MLLLVLLAVLAIIAFGVGFTIHWLFIVAVVLALVWLITLLMGGIGRRRRTSWFTAHAGCDGLRSSCTPAASALRPSAFSARTMRDRSETNSPGSAP